MTWRKRIRMDELTLVHQFHRQIARGRLHREFMLRATPDSREVYLDGLIFLGHDFEVANEIGVRPKVPNTVRNFSFANENLIVIEAKECGNRELIGQVLGAKFLLRRMEKLGTVRYVALCNQIDPDMLAFAQESPWMEVWVAEDPPQVEGTPLPLVAPLVHLCGGGR